MSCYKPLKGFRSPGGQIKFTRQGAYSDRPVTVSCGQCSGCRLERSRQWAIRLMHEAQMHERTCFLTLTYNDEHLPPRGTLVVEHWQDFAKRWRHRYGKFRFFHCGEYGDRNGRPHYHAAIFGEDWFLDRKYYRETKQGHTLYTSKKLDDLWTQGQVFIGDLTFQSAAYIARYILKKQLGEAAWKHYGTTIESFEGEAGTWHQRFHFTLKPEYITMSRHPGMGATWIQKYMSDVYPSDEVIVNGHPTQPPSFYDAELEKVSPKALQKIKALRRHKASKHEENNTYWRLETREKVQKAKTRSLTRDL